jgi:hypothetical protein
MSGFHEKALINRCTLHTNMSGTTAGPLIFISFAQSLRDSLCKCTVPGISFTQASKKRFFE